jgi:hypothetical protein
MHGEPLGKLGKLWALGHEPGLEGELDQDSDAFRGGYSTE